MKINQQLKRIAGEDLSRFLALNFNQDWLLNSIRTYFNNNGKDIKRVDKNEYVTLKNFFNSLNEDVKKQDIDTRTAAEILDSVGYTLISTPTFDDYKPFEKWFRAKEILCKFNDSNRAERYNLYWIFKKDFRKIKPSSSPSRQDDYSTSICSIAISKDGKNVTQITSRYNHTVSGCDNTFGSNLENIAEGLTDAFNRDFGFSIGGSTKFELSQFVFISNKYVWYSKEINGIKIGDNTIVTDCIINYNSDIHYTYDYFIINLKTNKIIWDHAIFNDAEDSFVSYFNNTVKKIVFIKDVTDIVDTSDEICYIKK